MKKILNKKEPELESLENSQPIHITQKNEKVCCGKNTKGVTGQLFAKETRHVPFVSNHHLRRNVASLD